MELNKYKNNQDETNAAQAMLYGIIYWRRFKRKHRELLVWVTKVIHVICINNDLAKDIKKGFGKKI
jgi:hypothetical protein